MNHYKTIWSSEVEPERRALALRMLFMCFEHLSVRPDYEWIAPCSEEEATFSRKNDIGGLYSASEHTVYLRADSANLLHVVAHEVRHAWQIQNWGRPLKMYTAVTEADADRYADAALRAFVRGPSKEWEHFAKKESFPLKEAFDADPAQLEDHLLTRLSHMNLMFR